MTKQEAQDLVKALSPNFVVAARESPLASVGWEVAFNAKADGREVYAFTPDDAMMLAKSGHVLRRW